ncbi:hypothetical protein DRP77_00570 [Candidatus Poribacteria bacterium]|nr:MAG: hypothetical protein DRP77_00570 [Candidatus Poribacteria bacterium]
MKLRPVSHRELVSKLRALGFEGPYGGGKHLFMVRGNLRLVIPNPHGGEISVGLLRRILKRAGVSVEEWLRV